MNLVTYLIRGFPGAFRECSDWLAGWCLPWRWVTDGHAELRSLREDHLVG